MIRLLVVVLCWGYVALRVYGSNGHIDLIDLILIGVGAAALKG